MIKVLVTHHGWKRYPTGSEVKFDDDKLDELKVAEQTGLIKIIKMPDVIEKDSYDKLSRGIKGLENIDVNDITSED